jgi:hypothetical protein
VKRAAIALLAAALFCTAQPRVSAQEEFPVAPDNRINSVPGTVVAQPDSQIEVTAAVALQFVMDLDAAVTNIVSNSNSFECAYFVNNGPKVVTRVRVRFTYLAGNGDEFSHNIVEIRGKFPAGAKVGGTPTPGYTIRVPSNCRTIDMFDHPLDQYEPKKYHDFWYISYGKKEITQGVAALTATVDRVDFADGTSWIRPGAN